jgi:tRNA/rRNA methyltransferase
MTPKIKFILNAPRNPKNIGAAARGMANFGFRELAVVNPYAEAWRETRSAVYAFEVVQKAKKFASLKAAIRSAHVVIGSSAGSRRAVVTRWIGLEELRTIVHDAVAANKSVAMVFGSERSGLSNEDLAFCHYVLRIPTDAACPSMNLSQAVAVVACAMRFEKIGWAKRGLLPQAVSVEHTERLIGRALEAYRSAGLLKGWDDRRAEARIRTAFNRWNLTEVDVAMLHGLFAWVLKKTAKGSDAKSKS